MLFWFEQKGIVEQEASLPTQVLFSSAAKAWLTGNVCAGGAEGFLSGLGEFSTQIHYPWGLQVISTDCQHHC